MASKLFINGEILTVNNNDEVHEAVAIKDNLIVEVGSSEKVLKYKTNDSEIIDLKGKAVIPGIIEAHAHITEYGMNHLSLNCKEIESISDLLKHIKYRVGKSNGRGWVRAWGFNELKVSELRYPTIDELDSISKDIPIIIRRACGHISIVNSKALEMAEINKQTLDPPGGVIERDSEGNFTGRLLETASSYMASVAAYTEEEILKANQITSEKFIEKGITSIHDASGIGLENLRMLQVSSFKNDLIQRIYTMVGSLNNDYEYVKTFVDSGIITGLGDTKFKIGPVKLFLDGSSSGPTIWTREPYDSDSNNYGISYYTQKEVDDLMIEAHRKGFQLTVHAQGDAAIEMILNTIEKAQYKYPRPDVRHRIEHAGIAADDLIARMKKLNVTPTPNPAFLYEYGDSYVENYGIRGERYYPLKSILRAGLKPAITSDSPVTDFSPMRGIVSAMRRTSNSGKVLSMEERISFKEALRMYTIYPARLSYEENIKGSIEVGKLADLVIFQDSIINKKTDELLDMETEFVVLDGEIVYQKKKG